MPYFVNYLKSIDVSPQRIPETCPLVFGFWLDALPAPAHTSHAHTHARTHTHTAQQCHDQCLHCWLADADLERIIGSSLNLDVLILCQLTALLPLATRKLGRGRLTSGVARLDTLQRWRWCWGCGAWLADGVPSAHRTQPDAPSDTCVGLVPPLLSVGGQASGRPASALQQPYCSTAALQHCSTAATADHLLAPPCPYTPYTPYIPCTRPSVATLMFPFAD